MSSQPDITKDKPEKKKAKPAPKKFLFDFADSLPQKNESLPSYESETLELEAYIPLILGFDPPQDYKTAYESISEYAIRTFNEIHQLVFTGFSECLPEVFGTNEVKDCVKFLREVIINLCKKLKKLNYEKSLKSSIEDYEKLLQKAEVRVRDLIKNEQIYRISFDQFTYRHDETERTMADIQNKLKEKKLQVENLTQENTKLTSVIHHKDEELKTMLIQNQTEVTPSPLIKASSQPESSSLTEQQKAKLRTLNLNNLKVLLNNNKATPMDSSRLTPSMDSTRGLTSVKKSARVSSPTLKPKSLERGERSVGSGSQLLLKIGTGDKLKEMGNALKHRIEVLTERRKLDLSAEIKLNSPDQMVENFNFNVRGLKNASGSQIVPQEQTKAKSPTKKVVKYDSFKEEIGKSVSVNSARLKTYDDNHAFTFKDDISHGNEVQSATVMHTERKKKDSLQYQIQAKREYQLLNTTRETKSGISKARPIMTELEGASHDKSADFKTMILKNKQLAYGISNTKAGSKDKSLKLDNKDGKMSPNNPVFMNIMLKKLGSQKSKKAL